VRETLPGFTRTALAEDDLVDIWLYIAEDNPRAADALLDNIDRKCDLLAQNPQLGQARPDIAPELRYFPVGNYLILYRITPEGIEIVRVVHGARKLANLFLPI
jgi:toxin ParE1/3/4